jgi:NDP-sugar pyrophosphorylase family protein
MMNGDILTTLDYGALLRSHVTSGNALTVATHIRSVVSDYGVLEVDGYDGATGRITGFREKPRTDHSVSMGVYIVDRRVCEYVPHGQRFDVPDLVWRLLEAGERVGAFPFDGFWLDIGRHEDYATAIDRYDELRELLLPVATAEPAPLAPLGKAVGQ